MIHFDAAWLAGGFIALGIPVLIHFIHRRRIRHTQFSAIEFLSDVLMQQQQRMRLNNILILIMRTACIFFLVAALCRPQWISPNDAQGNVERQGPCAALILIDDSASTHEVLDTMKELTLSYIDTLINGDEISILSSSGRIDTNPMYDLESARDIIRKVESCDMSSSIPHLLERGLHNIRRHLNPEREIVIVSDGQVSSWQSEDHARWRQLQTACTRAHIHLVHLRALRTTQHNISISHIQLRNHLFSVGEKAQVSIHIRSNQYVNSMDALLRVRKDGRIIDERIIHCNKQQSQTVSLAVQFNSSGSHYMNAELLGLHDAIQADNQRGVSIVVNDSIPVLLVDAFSGEQTYYMKQALLATNTSKSSIFEITQCDIADLHNQDFDSHKVIVLTDVPALDQHHIATLERYIVSGGSVLVCLGPHSDPASMNAQWVRNGDGFLPAYVKSIQKSSQQTDATWFDVSLSVQQHPALRSLPHATSIPFRNTFSHYHRLQNDRFQSADDAATVLMQFPNGDPFLLERKRGEGRVLLCASSFDMQWGILPQNPLFVPWIRGLCSYMASFLLPPRTIDCGQSIAHPVKSAHSWHITDDLRHTIPCILDRSQGRQVLRSDPITKATVYTAHTDTSYAYYVANVPLSESDTDIIDRDVFPPTMQLHPIHNFDNSYDISQAWDTERGHMLSLWRYFLILSLLCLVAEIAITHHVVMRERQLNYSHTPNGGIY